MNFEDKHLFELVFSVKRKCQATEERICNDYGITLAEFNGFMALDYQEALLGSAFADRMGLSPSRGSRILNKMMENEFVSIEYQPEDRRKVAISLTARGREMKKKLENRLDECEKRVLSAYDNDQVRMIKHALVLLDKAL